MEAAQITAPGGMNLDDGLRQTGCIHCRSPWIAQLIFERLSLDGGVTHVDGSDLGKRNAVDQDLQIDRAVV